jgi:protein involved in polysaccharide export with SLBB domain
MIRAFVTTAVLCLLVTGCGSTSPVSRGHFGSSTEAGSESRLRTGDQLTVRLDTGGTGANSQPQGIELAVDENGDISLPYIGHVPAAGLTSSELAERIQASYVPRFYVHCTATVLTKDRFFYVGGEVRGPSRYPWTEDVSLMKAINTAGGFTDYANRGKVEVTRGKTKQIFNCEDLRQHPAKDVAIQPGDSIYVPRSIF